MNLADDLLIILTSYSQGYKLMRRRMAGYTGPARFVDLKQKIDIKESTLRTTLSRLKKRGLVENSQGIWIPTLEGRKYIIRRVKNFIAKNGFFKPHSHPDPLVKKKQKSLIIVFDIPEQHRKKRDWLRIELTILGFVPLQKSVWFGPAPLPPKFIKDLADLKLLTCVKFFEAREHEII
jgi:phenylacetic acid degradation operon negative regulatory protein